LIRRALRILFTLAAVVFAVASCGEQINYPSPTINSLSPTSIVAGQPQFTLTVIGQKFVPASQILWNGRAVVQTLYTNAQTITALIPVALFETGGVVQISVDTPQPGGGSTLTLPFTINGSVSPVPAITSITPSTAIAGAGSFTVHVTGTGFVPASEVMVNGVAMGTGYTNSTILVATIPGSSLSAIGTLNLSVFNPQPNGGVSNVVLVPVYSTPPSLTTISPTSAAVNVASETVTVTGAGFYPGSVVYFNGTPLTTTYSSSTTVSAAVPSGVLGLAGVFAVQVFNAGTGGGFSNALGFAVNATSLGLGLPQLVDLGPNGVLANNGIGNVGFSGPSIAGTGAYVAFASISTNLVANNTNAASDVFVRSTCAGSASCTPKTVLASVSEAGAQGNGASLQPALESSGRYVAFSSVATNLDPDFPTVNGSTQQVYIRDTSATTPPATMTPVFVEYLTSLVSVAADGVSPANADANSPAISPDGRFVAFVSAATNLVTAVPTNGISQVYLRDTCLGFPSEDCTPTTYLVSSPNGITAGNGPSSQPSLSTDAQYVSFTSTASNLIGLTSAASQIYLRELCTSTATTTPGINTITCNSAVAPSLISSPDGVTPGNGSSYESSVTSDGNFFVYVSTATNLAQGVASTIPQIYMLDSCLTPTTTTTTTCTRSMILISSPDMTTSPTTPGNLLSEYPSVSSDGQYVAFASEATNIAPNTTNGFENIFVRNTCLNFEVTTTGETCEPTTVLRSVSSTSTVEGNGDSSYPQISQDGHTVAFLSSANNLVSTTNNLTNIFLGATSF
jgi:WD40-like Beta Propeller Repeat